MVVGLWSGCGGEVEVVKETKVDIEVVKEIKVRKTLTVDGILMEEYQYYNHPKTNRRIKDGWYNS